MLLLCSLSSLAFPHAASPPPALTWNCREIGRKQRVRHCDQIVIDSSENKVTRISQAVLKSKLT